MMRVIHAFLPDAKDTVNRDELKGLYRSVLNGKRTILLLDNARDTEQVLPLLPPEGCFLIVTSRQKLALPGAISKHLDVLSPSEARMLLLKIASGSNDRADEIAGLCGYLPMALRLIASLFTSRPDLSAHDIITRMQDTNRFLGLTGIEASLEISYKLLDTKAQSCWRMLGVFPATFDLEAAAAVWALDIISSQDAIGDMLYRSLVEYDWEAGRYHLHDLARFFAFRKLTEQERRMVGERHAIHYKKLVSESFGIVKTSKDKPINLSTIRYRKGQI